MRRLLVRAHPLDTHIVGTLSQEQKDSVKSAVLLSLAGLIEALFARSWDNYLAWKDEILRHVAVRSFVEENLREDVTADVAMELEDITVKSKKLGMCTFFTKCNAFKYKQRRDTALKTTKMGTIRTRRTTTRRAIPLSGTVGLDDKYYAFVTNRN